LQSLDYEKLPLGHATRKDLAAIASRPATA
jgi:hypothetical protein